MEKIAHMILNIWNTTTECAQYAAQNIALKMLCYGRFTKRTNVDMSPIHKEFKNKTRL